METTCKHHEENFNKIPGKERENEENKWPWNWAIIQVNPFVPNATFLYPLKTLENRKVGLKETNTKRTEEEMRWNKKSKIKKRTWNSVACQKFFQ